MPDESTWGMDEMVYIYHIRQGILEKQFWVFSLREVPKEI